MQIDVIVVWSDSASQEFLIEIWCNENISKKKKK